MKQTIHRQNPESYEILLSWKVPFTPGRFSGCGPRCWRRRPGPHSPRCPLPSPDAAALPRCVPVQACGARPSARSKWPRPGRAVTNTRGTQRGKCLEGQGTAGGAGSHFAERGFCLFFGGPKRGLILVVFLKNEFWSHSSKWPRLGRLIPKRCEEATLALNQGAFCKGIY